jgi:hypothetical protein
VGESATRPDAALKVRGEFAYSSDLFADTMLWGATGVHAVLTHDDVPGENRYGLEHRDQPVLAEDVVRDLWGSITRLVAYDLRFDCWSRGALVLVDESCEDFSSLDPLAGEVNRPGRPDGLTGS